jgi:hypothetical protein
LRPETGFQRCEVEGVDVAGARPSDMAAPPPFKERLLELRVATSTRERTLASGIWIADTG